MKVKLKEMQEISALNTMFCKWYVNSDIMSNIHGARSFIFSGL